MEQPQAPSAVDRKIAWYHMKWFVVLMLIVFFPIGLALLWTSPATKVTGRLVWTGIISLGVLLYYAGDSSSTQTTKATQTATSAPASAPAQSAPATPSPAPASQSTSRPAPASAPAPTWQTVKEWSGSGIKTTESFEIKSREWRIEWKSSNEQVAGVTQIFVYDDSDSLITLAANHQGAGGDVSYVRARPGRFYLTINSANVDWKVKVEDQR